MFVYPAPTGLRRRPRRVRASGRLALVRGGEGAAGGPGSTGPLVRPGPAGKVSTPAIVALCLVALLGCGGVGLAFLAFAYFAGDMASIRGPVTVATSERVCVDDSYGRGERCLARSDIRILHPSIDTPDAAAIRPGQCLDYLAPKRFQHQVDVDVSASCSSSATTIQPGRTSTTTR